MKELYPKVNITQNDLNEGKIIISGENGDYLMLSMVKQNNHIRSGIHRHFKFK